MASKPGFPSTPQPSSPPKTASHTYIQSPTSDLQRNDALAPVRNINQPDLNVVSNLVVNLNHNQAQGCTISTKEGKTPWTSLLKSKPPSAGKEELTFCEPIYKDGILQIKDEVRENGAKEWENMVVGFFIDKKLPYSLVKSAVQKHWNLEGEVDIMLDGDLFYFCFNSPVDQRYVIDEGSFHILGRLFVIRQWSIDVEESRGQITSIPIWVKFYKLPKFLWNTTGFSLIGSVVGKPLFPDKNTESKKMLTFARICIDVDASKALPLSIPIQTTRGKTTNVEVEYDWKPSICTTCKSFGHETQRCGTTTTSKPQTQGWNTVTNKGTRNVWSNNKDAGRQENTTSRPEVAVTNSFAAIQNVDEQELTLQVNMPKVLETDQLAQSKEDASSSCSRVVESQLPEEGEFTDGVRIEDGVVDALFSGTPKIDNTSKEDKDIDNAIVSSTMGVIMSREPAVVGTSVLNKAALEALAIKARLSELGAKRQSM